jgi:beta-galactosidase/beta-glucuronidase
VQKVTRAWRVSKRHVGIPVFGSEQGANDTKHLDAVWSWYRTVFDVPSSWTKGNRVLLNFGAVDYHATVWVNQRQVGSNVGGYWSFTIDITDALTTNGTNEL